MKISNKWIIFALIPMTALVFSACEKKKGDSATSAIEADIFSLRKTALTTDSPVLEAPVFSQKEPGESLKITPAFYGAPPMIPHKIDPEISGLTNNCLECHEEGDAETPGVPETHKMKPLFSRVQYAKAKGGATTYFTGDFGKVTKVAGERYNCMLCHAPQATNLKPLVDNEFVATTPKDDPKDVLDQLNEVGEY